MSDVDLEQRLRDHLRDRAESGPAPTELRESVRRRLEEVDGHPSARPRHGWLVAATVVGLIAALGVGLSWLARSSDRDVDVAVDRNPIATPVPVSVSGTPLATESFRAPFTVTVPDDLGFDVAIATESSTVVELLLTSATNSGSPATVRFVSSPTLVSVDAVVETLTDSLVDTRLVAVEDATIDGYPSRVVRIESDLGMTVVGFKFGPGVFLSASGVDRRYDAHVVNVPSGILVVWIDAATTEIDSVRDAADQIVSTLQWES